MGINSTEVAYGFGQMGSVYATASQEEINPPTGKVFVAITFLADTIFDDAGALEFEVKSSWVDLLQLVLITVIGAYFGGRSLEKVKK